MSKNEIQKPRKNIKRRPALRACLVYWDEGKDRFRITSPKTSRTCVGIKAEVVLLLTDKLEKRDLKYVEVFQQTLAESEVGMTCTRRGRISFSDLQALATS